MNGSDNSREMIHKDGTFDSFYKSSKACFHKLTLLYRIGKKPVTKAYLTNLIKIHFSSIENLTYIILRKV